MVELLKVRAARTFSISGATYVVALDISKAFGRVWHAGLLHKLKCYRISSWIFNFISLFRSNIQLFMVVDGRPSEK